MQTRSYDDISVRLSVRPSMRELWQNRRKITFVSSYMPDNKITHMTNEAHMCTLHTKYFMNSDWLLQVKSRCRISTVPLRKYKNDLLRQQKKLSASAAVPPDPVTRGSAPGPRWGQSPQTSSVSPVPDIPPDRRCLDKTCVCLRTSTPKMFSVSQCLPGVLYYSVSVLLSSQSQNTPR